MEPIDQITDAIETGPFHEVQVSAGASFYEDMGWLWTRSFGDPVAEYWAVRRDVGLWDVSALVKWRFTGPEALVSLDRLTTRRIAGAAPGDIRYGLVLNEEGALLDEGTTCVIAPDDAYFMGNDERPAFEEHLERVTEGFDVKIENVTVDVPNISVQGPRSFALLSALTGADLASLGYFRLIPEQIELAGVRGSITRTGFSGELGYEFFLDDASGARQLWNAIAGAGARPIGLDAVELLRIEAGLVIQDEDYFPGETDPYDLSLERFIDLEGHGFVGREVCFARAEAPSRRFITLVLDGGDPPEPGTRVTWSRADVGVVRSSRVTPRFGCLALSVVDSAASSDGERVVVNGRPATVRPLPIDDPGRRRPRSDPRRPQTVD